MQTLLKFSVKQKGKEHCLIHCIKPELHPSTNQKRTQLKREFWANVFSEHRCKNPRNAEGVQHMQIIKCSTAY
jgi:hypothetical protein